MPTIVLTDPFIHHYAGSVFQLSDAIGDSGWDDDDRVRDRQPCHDKRVYHLPDNGKGIETELPLDFTFQCPEKILENVDLKSGPCRITSISKSLEKPKDDPYYIHPLPLGKGKILYQDSERYSKNKLFFDIQNEHLLDTVIIKNRVNNDIKSFIISSGDSVVLSFDDFGPGFYDIDLLQSKNIIHSLTMIKCYPLVVKTTKIRSQYQITKTIW